MRIRLLQLRVDLDEPVDSRIERVAALVREQRGVDLVVLPELWPNGAFAYRQWAPTAEPLDGPLVQEMTRAVRGTGAHLHMGSFIERDGDHLYNTSVVLGPDGDLLATYRKIHLFGFTEGEPALLTAGPKPVVWDSPWGVVGLTTCYDLRFPELYRSLVDAGARMALVVAGWPTPRVDHWSLLARARAVENQLVVAAVNTVGQQGRTELGGRSVVVDARGQMLAEAGTEDEVIDADVDLDDVDVWRVQFPVLADRVL